MENVLENEQIVRRIIYVLLLAVAPGFVFLIQVVLFLPPALIFSGVTAGIWTQLSGGGLGSLAPVGFFLAHFLVQAGFYWLIAFVLGKLVVLPRQPGTIKVVLGSVLLGILGVSQFSIYGGGGHGPSKMGPLQSLFVESTVLPGNGLLLYFGSVASFVLVAVMLSAVAYRKMKQPT